MPEFWTSRATKLGEDAATIRDSDFRDFESLSELLSGQDVPNGGAACGHNTKPFVGGAS